MIVLAICAVVLVTNGMNTPAEAKKFKPHIKPHISHKVGKSFARHGWKNAYRRAGQHAARDIRRAHRAGRWINGLWVASGVAAGVAAATRNCNYYYRRYQETRNPHWRDKYNACIR
jgi:hypothetical protein